MFPEKIMSKPAKKSPRDAATPKIVALDQQFAEAKQTAERLKERSKKAKAALKLARKAHKDAKRKAKDARKTLNSLKKALNAATMAATTPLNPPGTKSQPAEVKKNTGSKRTVKTVEPKRPPLAKKKPISTVPAAGPAVAASAQPSGASGAGAAGSVPPPARASKA